MKNPFELVQTTVAGFNLLNKFIIYAWQGYNPNLLHRQEQIPSVAPVEFVGFVHGSENPSIFVPGNDPVSFQWFYDDVPAIVCAHQCSMNFIISQGAVSGQSRDFGSY